jgi:hypothetical protein
LCSQQNRKKTCGKEERQKPAWCENGNIRVTQDMEQEGDSKEEMSFGERKSGLRVEGEWGGNGKVRKRTEAPHTKNKSQCKV